MQPEQQITPNVQQEFKKKPTIVYWILIFAPFVALIFSAVLQIISTFVFTTVEGDSGSNVLIDIITLIIGVVSVLAIFMLPLWIVLLVQAIKHNNNVR